MQAVGFDMDYTLAQYKPDTFEKLAHHLTVQKLVSVFGYPEVSQPPMPAWSLPHFSSLVMHSLCMSGALNFVGYVLLPMQQMSCWPP